MRRLRLLFQFPTHVYLALLEVRALYAFVNDAAHHLFISKEEHDHRVRELLEANNKGVEERRKLQGALVLAEEVMDEYERRIDELETRLSSAKESIG